MVCLCSVCGKVLSESGGALQGSGQYFCSHKCKNKKCLYPRVQKYCWRCKRTRGLAAYWKNGTNKDGLADECIDCLTRVRAAVNPAKCAHCGADFYAGYRKKSFCSRSCAGFAREALKRESV